MNLVVISDDDFALCNLPGGGVDLLISCGDLTDESLKRAVGHYSPRQTFAVRGNHDVDTPFPDGVTDLHLAIKKWEGLRFGGFGGSWKYKPRGHHLFEQSEVAGFMKHFPFVDVFVAHNSPAGIHERDTGVHQGFAAFRDYVARCQPLVLIHGHQHTDSVTVLGTTTIIGVYGERRLLLEPPPSGAE